MDCQRSSVLNMDVLYNTNTRNRSESSLFASNGKGGSHQDLHFL